MPTHLDTHVLGIAALVVFIAWRQVSRIRRMIGRQRLTRARPWITIVVFPLLAALVIAGSLANPMVGVGVLAGAALGIVLGLVGIRLTKFEATPAGLFYTPNAHLGIALSLVFVLRLGYRFAVIGMNGGPADPQSMQMASNPLTMAIFGTLASYYVTYAIGLLRWRARVSTQAPAEH